MNTAYRIHSGRRPVGVRHAPSPAIALVDYVRALGCRDDEIHRLGPDAVAWRGAVFRAVPVPDEHGAR